MKTNVLPNYEEMSLKASEFIIDCVNRKPDSLVCFAAGNSPLGTFSCLVEAAKQGKVNFDRCRFISLDEWVGLSAADEGSCRQTLDEHFFKPLGIEEANIHFFDGQSADLQAECARMDAYIAAHGKIDLLLLGVGMNGHLGFNEPGVSADLYTHVIDLDSVTLQVSSKYFKEKKELRQGITLGIKHMLEADTVLVEADGAKKADIIHSAFCGPVSEQVPASILQRHPNAHLFVDEGAGQKIV